MLKKLNLRDLTFFIGGMLILTLGIRVISLSSLGLAFSDALFIRISEMFNIPASASSLIVGIVTLFVASVLQKKRPKFECLISSFILGFFVDFWLLFFNNVNIDGMVLNVSVFLIGVFILSMGISIYLQPGFPPHPNDFLFMTIKERFNISIFRAKIIMDGCFAFFAIVFLAPIGIGSIFNTLCLGVFINKGFDMFEKIYNKK